MENNDSGDQSLRGGEAPRVGHEPGSEVDEEYAPPLPDDVDLVTEVAAMMAVLAAQRFFRIDVLRRNALADASRYGSAIAEVVERSVRLEVAAALRITEHTADGLLATAEALVHRYPAALESLGRAAITEQHARTLVALLDAASPDVRERVLPRAVILAEQTAVGTFRRGLRRLVDVAEATTLAARYEAALDARLVVVEPAEDGLAWLHALIPAVEAHAIHNRLTSIGKALKVHPDEERTLDQLRADSLGDLLVDGDTSSIAPEARGIRATVTVTVPALSLLGDPTRPGNSDRPGNSGRPGNAEHPGERHGTGESVNRAHPSQSHEPAIVDGLGPIPLKVARELCGGADGWMRVLTHPETGVVLSVGRTQYRPPPALRRLVRWRAGRCMAPGCGIPASRCEIDHTVAWEHGGHTCACNLAPLCKGHHTIKHHGGWTVQHLEGSPGSLRWTSPSGRQYIEHPERRIPVFHPTADTTPAPF